MLLDHSEPEGPSQSQPKPTKSQGVAAPTGSLHELLHPLQGGRVGENFALLEHTTARKFKMTQGM